MSEWQPKVYTDREKVLDYIEIVGMALERYEVAKDQLWERANQLIDVRDSTDLSELSSEEIKELNRILNLSFGRTAN